MARSYRRDSRGRFAGGGGGGGSGRPAAKAAPRGKNRLTRDNAGKITSVGGNGATARGGRLKTTSGNQRATQTVRVKAGAGAGRVAKPKGMKPQDGRKLRMGIALSRTRAVNAKIADRPDLAQVNIKGRFRGQAGKRYEAGLDRAVGEAKAAERARLMKPKQQVRAEAAALKAEKQAAAAAKPKRTRTPESLRMSRAKQIGKRRSISMNPAGWRSDAAGRMAANAQRTQERALSTYGAKPRRR